MGVGVDCWYLEIKNGALTIDSRRLHTNDSFMLTNYYRSHCGTCGTGGELEGERCERKKISTHKRVRAQVHLSSDPQQRQVETLNFGCGGLETMLLALPTTGHSKEGKGRSGRNDFTFGIPHPVSMISIRTSSTYQIRNSDSQKPRNDGNRHWNHLYELLMCGH